MAALDPHAARTRAPHAAVLDCRGDDAFAHGHLPGSGHLPFDTLRERRSELPPRGTPVLVIAGDAAAARSAAELLGELGYAHVDWLDAAPDALRGEMSARGPAAALWRPSPFLHARVSGIPAGRALDLAAGAGREAVTLAQHGFDVEAWDHAPEALDRAQALAATCGVRLETRVVNLEKKNTRLPVARYDLITVFRFLHRPLLPGIAAALAPGGHLLYETFRRGQERHGRPSHPRFLLWPDELKKAFESLECLFYEESEPEGGPIMARLHARRRPDRTKA